MATTVKVRSGQTLLDVCIQELGTASRLFELAKENNMLPSTRLEAGMEILLLAPYPWHKAATKHFKNNPPSSEVSGTDATLEGIGYWTIGGTNTVQ